MFRKIIACLLVAIFLANVGCSTLPPYTRVGIGPARDLVLKRLAAIWKDDIPIRRTDHTFYPTVEQLPGAAFRPTPLPLANVEDTTPIDPGDYEIPVHFYCTGVYMPTGSGYRYRLAKLEGKSAEALTQLYVRASQAGTPTDEVQVLSWSLQTGIAYDDLNAPQRALVDRLIPDYRAQMQLGLTEKIMRDWKAWSSIFPLVSPEVILPQMGEVGAYISMLMRAREDILNRNYRYDALWALFAPRRDAAAPADQEKSPWSRIHPRIYMRFIVPRGAKSDGVIQLRIVDGHSHSQQSSNTTLVMEACSSLAQVAFADSPGPDGITPPMITQSDRIARVEVEAIPDAGPIPARQLREPAMGAIGIADGAQSVTATVSKEKERRVGPPTQKPVPVGPCRRDTNSLTPLLPWERAFLALVFGTGEAAFESVATIIGPVFPPGPMSPPMLRAIVEKALDPKGNGLAITIGSTVWFRGPQDTTIEKDLALLAHEMVHVLDYKAAGLEVSEPAGIAAFLKSYTEKTIVAGFEYGDIYDEVRAKRFEAAVEKLLSQYPQLVSVIKSCDNDAILAELQSRVDVYRAAINEFLDQ
jgi:hypothetical protein